MKKFSDLVNIQKLLTEISDFVFPPSTEEKLLRGLHTNTLISLYRPGVLEKAYCLSEYSEPVIRAAVLENKFHHNPLAATHLRAILKHWVSKQTKPTLYIPIPLGIERLRQRGHNQVETILEKVVPRKDIGTKVLRRPRETLPQSQLDKTLRHKNVKGAFEFVGKTDAFKKYTQVVLVDDVLTTGATLEAARASLAPHLPPNITLVCLAIAH